jgi:hypothetical protein
VFVILFKGLEAQKLNFEVLDNRLIEAELELMYSPEEYTIPLILDAIIDYCAKHQPAEWGLLMISQRKKSDSFREVRKNIFLSTSDTLKNVIFSDDLLSC